MWCPDTTLPTLQAVARSFFESFPYARSYAGFTGHGSHFLGSMQPIKSATAAQLCARMPPAARRDFMEWMDAWSLPTLLDAFQAVMSRVQPLPDLLNPNPNVQVTDDRPFNEYFLLREQGFYSP